ncbi:6-hydroxypseudooxynicotine dehydrogenase complex subunit alpha [bioreactor metagenome]|uniref:6-hydroxypseudooxynicotine dehydrogenase complex subunit alpha n=1 Tax=bioreactor metagenome TaxID=1076179 RepID=A0A644XUX0_9ZZZZ
MIPFDFVYCRPDTPAEAYEAFLQLQSEGKNPAYYAGGSEIITMCRAGSIRPGAVIDIKRIPECMSLSADAEGLHIGCACTLSQIKDSKLFPLLTLACGRIADHTNQCRITLGGNLCGTILYRETSLPLLLSDSAVTIFGGGGLRTLPLQSVFRGRLRLGAGEFAVRLHVPAWALQARHFHVKRTANEKIDYPLVSMSALVREQELRAAFSGVCAFPFRSGQIEAVLNNRALSCADRAEQAALLLPAPALQDVEGSGEYRTFVFKNMVQALLEEVEHGQV